MKALTFLGTGKYEPTIYVWKEGNEERSCETHLFPEAVARIFDPEKISVLVTPEVKKHINFKTLCNRLGSLVEQIDIPEGKSEEEIWTIFQRCTDTVADGDSILLDITHAFRSIPLLIFAVAAYLRRTKQVTVQRIIYGAFEARDLQTNRTPILDLTPLLDLLDWLSSAEALLERSEAEQLAHNLAKTHHRLWVERASEQLPKHLQSIAAKLRSLSRALHLSRPLEAMKSASDLLPMLDKAADELERWAKPFRVILEQVSSEVAELAYDHPQQLDTGNLRKQLALIKLYLRKGLAVQAITLAREWLVSWVILKRGQGDWLDPKQRESAERELGAAAYQLRERDFNPPNSWLTREVAELWNCLTDLRNNVAHCGMRKQVLPAQSIEHQVSEIPQRLWALLDGIPENTLRSGRVVIDVKDLYSEVAKLDELPLYIERAKELAGEGNEVVLTGQAPIWLYLSIAHALHGKARRLLYTSPTTGEVLIFDHSAR